MKNMKKIIAVLMSLTAITMTTSAFAAAGDGTAKYDADAKAVTLDSNDLGSATGQLTVVIVPVDAGKEGEDPITSGNIYYINQEAAGEKFDAIIDAMKVKDEFKFEKDKYEVRIGGEGFDEYLSYIITGEELVEILYGDVYKDNRVNPRDRITLNQYLGGQIGEDGIWYDAANLYKDARVNARDRILLNQLLGGLLTQDDLPQGV